MTLLRECTIFLSSVSAVPAILIGWRRRPLFWWYCLVSFSADAALYPVENNPLFKGITTNLFLLLEWLLISTYLTKALIPERYTRSRNAGIAIVAAGFIGWVLHSGISNVSYLAAVVFYSIYIALLLACLYKIMRDIEYLQLDRSPHFLFCAVFLLFTSGSITLLGIRNYLELHNPSLNSNLWAIHNILNMLKNGILAYCIYLLQKQEK